MALSKICESGKAVNNTIENMRESDREVSA